MKPSFDLSLYLVTDSGLCGPEALPGIVEKAILGGVSLVQLREKDMNSRDLFHLATALLAVTHAHNVPLLIDDRVDIALAAGADGVHLGEQDLPLSIARRLLGPHKILGATAKTVPAALAARKEGADYLGVGALFPTTTKVITKPTEIGMVSAIKQAASLPVVAIGGINRQNISMLSGCGADGVAVVSAIMQAKNPQEEAAFLLAHSQKLP